MWNICLSRNFVTSVSKQYWYRCWSVKAERQGHSSVKGPLHLPSFESKVNKRRKINDKRKGLGQVWQKYFCYRYTRPHHLTFLNTPLLEPNSLVLCLRSCSFGWCMAEESEINTALDVNLQLKQHVLRFAYSSVESCWALAYLAPLWSEEKDSFFFFLLCRVGY